MYKGTGIFSWLIKKATRSEYSHASVVVWWNQRLMVMEAVGKGVIVNPLSHNVDHYHGDIDWYSSVQDIAPEQRTHMVQFAQQELGKSYDTWKAILVGIGAFFKKKVEEQDELRRSTELFCSHYVAEIYNAIGIDLKKETSDRFMVPDDIARSPQLQFRATIKKTAKE
jgi:hypothetical protein